MNPSIPMLCNERIQLSERTRLAVGRDRQQREGGDRGELRFGFREAYLRANYMFKAEA